MLYSESLYWYKKALLLYDLPLHAHKVSQIASRLGLLDELRYNYTDNALRKISYLRSSMTDMLSDNFNMSTIDFRNTKRTLNQLLVYLGIYVSKFTTLTVLHMIYMFISIR